MPIATAIQSGTFVAVYNEKNQQIMAKSGELHGHSGSTVSIRNGTFINTYDERGRLIGSRSAR